MPKLSWRGILFFLLPCVLGCSMEADRYLVPDGYVGWIQMRYEVAGAPPLPREGRFRIARISSGGLMETSSRAHGGDSPNEYLFVDVAGRTRPAMTQGRVSMGSATNLEDWSYYCFIGTAEQYERFGRQRRQWNSVPIIGSVSDQSLDPSSGREGAGR